MQSFSRMGVLVLALALALAACAQPAATPQTAPPAAATVAPKAPAAEAPKAEAPKTEATKAPAAAQAPAQPAGKYKEAPALAEQVKAGKLPAVEQRLPENPIVIKPIEGVGKYGGTMRSALRGGADSAWLNRTIFYENLVNWDLSFSKPVPNVAESWEISPDSQVYTFKLRKGLKWSDGKPFTADDILFWWELFLDTAVNPGRDPFFTVGGKPAEVTKVDDYTVRFAFAAPNGLFLQRLAHPDTYLVVTTPKHVLTKYHGKYNPDADKLAKERGFDNWQKYLNTLWQSGNMRMINKEIPLLTAWTLTAEYGAKTTVLTAERNPYYWKVDSAGNQLPYIDKWQFDVGSDIEPLLLKAVNGEIDLLARHINTLDNKSVIFDNQAKGNYSLFSLTSTNANQLALAFNLTNKDETKRKVFQSKDFRIGMSHAINRQEIIDTVLVGQGKPMQVAVPPTMPEFYNEQLARQYTEYSVAKAGEYLDKAGLNKKDGDGFRLGPDGKRFVVTIETLNTDKSWAAGLELIKGYWEKVGVKTELAIIDRALLQTHIDANEYEAIMLWPEGGGGQDLKLVPRWFAPILIHSGFGPGWYFNYIGDPKGKDWTPPENVAKSIAIYREILQTSDVQKQNELVKQMLQQAADNFFAIGISEPIEGYGIYSNKLMNVPKTGMWDSYTWPQPGPAPVVQFAFK